MNENSVSAKISFNTKESVKNMDDLINRINKTNRALGLLYNTTGVNGLNKQLENMNNVLEKIESNTAYNKQTKSIKSFKNSTSATTSIVNKLNNALKNSSNMLGKINNALKMPNLISFAYSLKNVASNFSTMINQSSSYLENLNMMQVAFGETREEAEGFVNGIADVFGLDESLLTRQLGFYKQIGNALAIDAEYADILAKNLLKLQLDMASLYNLSFERSGEVLQASMAGLIIVWLAQNLSKCWNTLRKKGNQQGRIDLLV